MGSSGVVLQFQRPTSVTRLCYYGHMATQQDRLQALKSNSERSFLDKQM